jgi:hypothetical protein
VSQSPPLRFGGFRFCFTWFSCPIRTDAPIIAFFDYLKSRCFSNICIKRTEPNKNGHIAMVDAPAKTVFDGRAN